MYYSLWKLLRGELADAFTEIRIENTNALVDTTRDANLTALVSDLIGIWRSSDAELLPENLVVSGTNLNLSVRTEAGELTLDRLFFSATVAGSVLSLRGQGDVEIEGNGEASAIPAISGRLQANGTVDVASGESLFTVTLPELRTELASVERQVLQISYDGQTIEARKVQDRDPVDVFVRIDLEPMEVYARVLADDYRVADLVTLDGELALFNEYLQYPVSGQISATLIDGSFSYDGSVLARLSVPQIPAGILSTQFSGDLSSVFIDNLRYETEQGTALYRGRLGLEPFRPDGQLTLQQLTSGGIDPLSLTANLKSVGNAIGFDVDGLRYAGTRYDSVSGVLTLGEAMHGEVEAIVSSGNGSISIRTDHDESGRLLRLVADGRNMEPDALYRLRDAAGLGFELPDLSFLPKTVIVDTRLTVDLTDGVAIEMPLFYAVDTASPDDHVSFSLSYSDETVVVRDAVVAYDGYNGYGNFSALLGKGGKISFESDLVIEEIPYQLAGEYDPATSLVLSGLYDMDAQFYFGERNELIFSVSGDLPLPIRTGADSRIAFDAEGYYFSESDWRIGVESLEASGIPYYRIDDSTIEIAGQFGPDGAELHDVAYSDEFSSLTGVARIVWDLAVRSGEITAELSSKDGAETYDLTLGVDAAGIDATSIRSTQIAVEADYARLPLLRLGIETLRGSLTGVATASGTLDSLSASATTVLEDGKFNNDPVELAGRLEMTPTSLFLSDASFRYVTTRVDDLFASVSLEESLMSLSGNVHVSRNTNTRTIGVGATGTLTNAVASFSDLLSSPFEAEIALENVPVQNDLPSTWRFRAVRSSDGVSIVGGPGGSLFASLRPDGSFQGAVGAPLPIAFDVFGRYSRGEFEADLTSVRANIPRLWQILDSRVLAFESGVATGSVRLVGPVNDPDFYGTLVADDVTGSVDMIPATLGPGRAFLVFDENVLSIRESVVSGGIGRARVSAAITLDRWLPEEFGVDVKTLEGEPVRVLDSFGTASVDGLAEGTLRINGDSSGTTISGALTASAMAITLTEREESDVPVDAERETRVDIDVTTGRGVEFLWPTDAFPILRGFADVGETVKVTYRANPREYAVVGPIDIQGGQVFYFDRSFYIREGLITFDETQEGFDPRLSVNAEIREVGPDGPVRIYLVADENPLSQFTPRWRSEPQMAEAEILAMLGGAVFVQQEGGPIDLSQAVLLTSDLVSQFGIVRGFETTIRDALQLDLFSIRTQLFQNLIRGVISDEEYPLDTRVPSLGEYLDNTTLFLGKYLGTDLFLELLVQLRATDPVAAPTQSLAGITLDSEFILEWQTPFFVLEWTFFPTDPSSLFLKDNTVSFSWEYSY